MPRKNNKEETATAVQDEMIETADTISDELNTIFEEDVTPDTKEKLGEFITLKKGGSYHYGDFKFVKNEPVQVDSEIAEKLMKTGFFKLGKA